MLCGRTSKSKVSHVMCWKIKFFKRLLYFKLILFKIKCMRKDYIKDLVQNLLMLKKVHYCITNFNSYA